MEGPADSAGATQPAVPSAEFSLEVAVHLLDRPRKEGYELRAARDAIRSLGVGSGHRWVGGLSVVLIYAGGVLWSGGLWTVSISGRHVRCRRGIVLDCDRDERAGLCLHKRTFEVK